MSTKEMRKTSCKPGYWFVNVAPNGAAPDWQQLVMPVESNFLFGYIKSDLLAKQYKAA